MADRIKDTDYLAISARIKAMETGLLTRERMEQVLEARTDEEAVKILQECGYPELDARNPEAMDAALSAARDATLSDVGGGAPDPRYIDIFKLKYDYHNIKAILKAEAMNTDPRRMLMDMGRVPAAELLDAVQSGRTENLPEGLANAAAEAKEVLDSTRDPQLSDLVLDRWCYQEMAKTAEDTGSEFLAGYVQVQIDSANLRSLIRTLRMGKSADFLKNVLLEGGTVDTASIAAIGNAGGSGLNELYGPTPFQAAAEAGAEALRGGALTEFEKLCDDAVGDYLAGAQFVPFGEAPLVGYLAARETEYTNIRILLMGRGAGLPAEVIRSRLRAGYV
ncbi:MAG: V-type ATPase subunit [Oscillibacter sp.]|nr:V-type ATPase subunit [Oscillibacter sp.]